MKHIELLKVKKSLWVSPVVVLSFPWIIAWACFLFKWTGLTTYSFYQISSLIGIVLVPFVLVFLLLNISLAAMDRGVLGKSRHDVLVHVDRIWFRVKCFFVFWLIISMIEVGLSKGLPVIWLITGSSLTYMDFGIHSLHGLMNSILLVCSLLSMLLFYSTGKKRFLFIPIISFIWGVAVISRALILSNMLQLVVLYIYINGLSIKKVRNILVSVILFIVAFGVIGDFRSGEFTEFVGSEGRYPDFLPSGFLWVYVYMMTPLNNLANTLAYTMPNFDFIFPNTISLLFPSVIRHLIFDLDAGKGNLVVEAFNISTAYVGPYKDFGLIGMALLSFLYACLSFFTWHAKSISGMIAYVIIAHCLLVSIFFNWLFFLPVAFQFVWIHLILYKVRF